MPSMIRKNWMKLFYSPYYFTIALRRKAEGKERIPGDFDADYVIPAGRKIWAADPMLVTDRDNTYLFYEAVHHDKGRIEVAKVYADATLSEPTVVLEDACHYSYPFVFRYEHVWYMIPESSASGELRLYKAEVFPGKWKLESILLRQRCVDTTVFQWEGRWYLLTYLPQEGTERVIPRAYRLCWKGANPSLEQIRWESYQELECRGAGPLYVCNNKLIRPAQKNEEQSYGNGLVFYEVEISEDCYCEKPVAELDSERIKAGKVWMDGLHTYAASACFEAIDIRCRAFDFWKISRYLWERAKRFINGGKH